MRWQSTRAAEWSLLVVVLLVMMGMFAHQFRAVQAQGELAAIKTTLGALRTALVIDHLERAVASKGQGVAIAQRNPFLLLARVPANYAGAFEASKANAVPPGNWVFDSYCNCIGYGPMHPFALDADTEAPMVWFRISAPPGPLQITPVQAYRWQGELVN